VTEESGTHGQCDENGPWFGNRGSGHQGGDRADDVDLLPARGRAQKVRFAPMLKSDRFKLLGGLDELNGAR